MKKRILLAAMAAITSSQLANAQSPAPNGDRHVLKLDDVELNTLIEDVSELTGYTFITHPDVRRSRVSVVSQTPMTTPELFQVFLTTLRIQGFVAVPAGRDTYRIMPRNLAASEAPMSGSGANAFLTEIIKLERANAMEVAQMVKPILDHQGQVVANASTNTLVIVDYASNIDRVRRVIETLDRDQTVVETIALRNIPAAEIEMVLMRLHGDTSGQAQSQSRFSAVASLTSNSVILRGDSAMVARAKRVAHELDETNPQRDHVRVITLNYADAAEVVPILERVGTSMAMQRAASDTAPVAQTIAHHDATNSLIISANPETILAMEKVVTALDVRRPQVMVEAIIVEMSDDAARELGLQFLLSGTGNSEIPFASTNFSRAAPNLLALAGAIITDGFSDTSTSNPFRDSAISSLTGSSGLTLGVGGTSGNTLFGAILNAVENDTASRILSTPFGMTLNNATSSLIVGQEIPVTTGQVLGDANSNPFRTVERQDVGIQLEVTPRIGENNTVRLDIRQEVSSVFGSIGTVTPDLILDKREIRASVLADDGEIIVLGGLIEQTDTTRTSKVPVLGDIPGVGRLFRSEGKGTTRTNLMVFLRPTIVRSKEDAQAATAQKYLYVQAEELMRGVSADSSIDRYVREVLGSNGPVFPPAAQPR